jgi:hypothetical protein
MYIRARPPLHSRHAAGVNEWTEWFALPWFVAGEAIAKALTYEPWFVCMENADGSNFPTREIKKYAMYAQNEQVHIAAWPSFSLYDPFAHALGAEVNNAARRNAA